MAKLIKEDCITIEGKKNDKYKVNEMVIISMIVDCVAAAILTILLLVQFIIYKDINYAMKREVGFLGFIMIYGILSEFMFDWHKDFKCEVFRDKSDYIEKIEFSYCIVPMFTNKTVSKIIIKDISEISKKKKKLIVYGDIIMHGAIKNNKLDKFVIYNRDFSVSEIFPYLENFQFGKNVPEAVKDNGN